jgi:DNA-nicking Smr family endonuclease
MTRRRLTPDERELWQRVARATRRLQPAKAPVADTRKAPVPDPGAPPPAVIATPSAGARRLQGASRPPVTTDLAPDRSEALAAAPVRMDKKLHARMTRGKLAPEARIDLHGLTLAAAQPELQRFIAASYARGLRLVLVITGKGRSAQPDDTPAMPRPAGVLRRSVPAWLRMAPLSGMVLDIREAHVSHGGGGAIYVYLRKRG